MDDKSDFQKYIEKKLEEAGSSLPWDEGQTKMVEWINEFLERHIESKSCNK